MASHAQATADRAPADTLLGSLVKDTGARFAWATAVLVVALFAAGLLGASPAVATAGALAVAGLTAINLPVAWRWAIALVAWALVTGFFYNSYGELTFTRPDLARMALLLAVAPLLSEFGRSHVDV